MIDDVKMERLDFTIPDFLRTVWASEAAKDYWELKIRRISDCWMLIERYTLLNGMRSGILQSIDPESLPDAQVWALNNSVPMAVLSVEGAPEGYKNATALYQKGKPFSYRVYFGKEPWKFLDAWTTGNHILIGHLLGFPGCCANFFQKYWVEDGWRDLTYHTFENPEEKNLMYNNVLLRHIGIRGVFHLPCSVSCRPSCEIGMQILNTMKSSGYTEEVEWLRELLYMPMQWSSLHGIAMVITPILKTIYASDPLPNKAVLNLHSNYYPKTGASGNTFPFINALPIHNISGFRSFDGMREAHRFILRSLLPIEGKILDLGCGSGHLLQEIKKHNPNTKLYGVDIDRTVINKAVPGVEYWCSDIYDFQAWQKFDLVMIAVQRFFEVDEDKAKALMEVLRNYAKRLLIYSYNGWYDSLDLFLNEHFNVVTVAKDPIMNYRALLLESKL